MVYKYIDIVGVSTQGITEAVKAAIDKTRKVGKSLRWANRSSNCTNRRWAEVGRVTVPNRKSKRARISSRSEKRF